MAAIAMVISETLENITFVPILMIIAMKMQTRNKNGSTNDSHIIVSIISTNITTTKSIHDGKIGV